MVAEGYRYDNLVDYSSYYQYMLDVNHPFIVMSGEFDVRDGAASQFIWMKKLLKLSDGFWEQPRSIYYYGDKRVGGYYQRDKNFTLMTVPKSGHYIPKSNYDASALVLKDMINFGHLQCHGEQCATTDIMCNAMMHGGPKSDEQGVCQADGTVKCAKGFVGADCSHKLLMTQEDDTTWMRNSTGFNTFYVGIDAYPGVTW